MTEYVRQILYQYCMLCRYAYKRADDADTIYCDIPEYACPHKAEIEQAERKKE